MAWRGAHQPDLAGGAGQGNLKGEGAVGVQLHGYRQPQPQRALFCCLGGIRVGGWARAGRRGPHSGELATGLAGVEPPPPTDPPPDGWLHPGPPTVVRVLHAHAEAMLVPGAQQRGLGGVGWGRVQGGAGAEGNGRTPSWQSGRGGWRVTRATNKNKTPGPWLTAAPLNLDLKCDSSRSIQACQACSTSSCSSMDSCGGGSRLCHGWVLPRRVGGWYTGRERGAAVARAAAVACGLECPSPPTHTHTHSPTCTPPPPSTHHNHRMHRVHLRVVLPSTPPFKCTVCISGLSRSFACGPLTKSSSSMRCAGRETASRSMTAA